MNEIEYFVRLINIDQLMQEEENQLQYMVISMLDMYWRTDSFVNNPKLIYKKSKREDIKKYHPQEFLRHFLLVKVIKLLKRSTIYAV
jgi:hypothetical protein